MPVQDSITSAVVGGATTLSLANVISVTGTANPAYLVVTALDRNEYTPASTGATGAFVAGAASMPLAATSGDARAAGIVYTWQAGKGGQPGQYVNAQFGALPALGYTTSASAADVTNIALFTTTSLALATADAANPVALMLQDPGGYAGSLTVVTDASPVTPAGGPQATPQRIAACAAGFVGRAWNDNGCWPLASTIAAEAGAGLPLQSTAIGVPGRANGLWVVAYNGPVRSSGNWQSLVQAGDVITFATPGGGGHVTTCVSGSGASAMLIDNITYQNSTGGISNSAHDGSPNDVLVAAAHPASQEWAGVQSASVVIYALDTPAVTAKVAVAALRAGVLSSLSAMAAISDPAGRAITQVQAYDPGKSATLTLHGAAVVGTAASPVTASALSLIGVLGVAGGTDTLELRAFNGTSWGDWAPVAVQVTAGKTAVAGAASAHGVSAAAATLEGRIAWAHGGLLHAGLAESGGWREAMAFGHSVF